MEQVRPRSALEYEVTVVVRGLCPPTTRLRRCPRIAILAVLVTGLALPAPSAFAHGNQFVCARVTIGDDGHVGLELTADYGDNPNIADADAAREVLREALRLQIGDDLVPLEKLGELRFSASDHYTDDSPVPSAVEPGPHRLVLASWQARLPGQRLVFVAKERTPLDVVMWQAGEKPSPGQSRWMLLIAGERSPAFVLTPAAANIPAGWFAGLALLAALPLLIWSRLRRRTSTFS